MNRLSVLVDVSHVSDKTMGDALDVSRAPLIASHSYTRGLANWARNIPGGLLQCGYSEEDIRKILGESFLRVFAKAEAVARFFQPQRQ